MSGFWDSEVGQVTGKPEDAFAKSFTIVPDNTMALAKIDKMIMGEFPAQSMNAGQKYISIDWLLTDGEFKGNKVNHKLKVCDSDPKVRHRALNMFALLYQTFGLKRKHNNMPTDIDFAEFHGQVAGIRIRETEPNHEGKQYNWVAEVHNKNGFVSESGVKLVVTHSNFGNQSSGNAFDRNPRGSAVAEMDDDIPF